MAEVREVARACHKNELSESIMLSVQVIVDINRLGDDLLAAGSVSSKAQLHTFFKAFSSAHSSISVIDCERAAVDAKMKGRL